MPGSRGKVSVKRDLWPSEEDSVSVPPSAPPMPATMPARGLCRRAGSSPGQPHFYQLGKAADAGERRAQLVRDGGQKNACGMAGLAGLGLADAQGGRVLSSLCTLRKKITAAPTRATLNRF